METQIEVNGQVIVLANTKPLRGKGYHQWRNVETGDTWNVDGSTAQVCLNADIAQYGIIKVQNPSWVEGWEDIPCEQYNSYWCDHNQMHMCKDEHNWAEVYGRDHHWSKSNLVQQVEEINPDNNWNQFEIKKGGYGNFEDTWAEVKCFERGVGYVPSCGSIVAAAASRWLFDGFWHKIEIYTDGGKYNVWRDYSTGHQEDGAEPCRYLIIEAENIVRKKYLLTNP